MIFNYILSCLIAFIDNVLQYFCKKNICSSQGLVLSYFTPSRGKKQADFKPLQSATGSAIGCHNNHRLIQEYSSKALSPSLPNENRRPERFILSISIYGMPSSTGDIALLNKMKFYPPTVSINWWVFNCLRLYSG